MIYRLFYQRSLPVIDRTRAGMRPSHQDSCNGYTFPWCVLCVSGITALVALVQGVVSSMVFAWTEVEMELSRRMSSTRHIIFGSEWCGHVERLGVLTTFCRENFGIVFLSPLGTGGSSGEDLIIYLQTRPFPALLVGNMMHQAVAIPSHKTMKTTKWPAVFVHCQVVADYQVCVVDGEVTCIKE